MKPYKQLRSVKFTSSEYWENHKLKKLAGHEYMLETSMTRMMSYVKENGVAILTAFRGNYNLEQNMRRHGLLKDQFRKNNIKVVEVDGVFVENMGKPDERRSEELSLAVPFVPENWVKDFYEDRERSDIGFGSRQGLDAFDKFINFVWKAGSIFNQDCVVVANPSEGVYLYYRTGKKVRIGATATPDKIGEAYTRLRDGVDKGRTFVFEGTRTPNGYMNAYQLVAEGILF